MQYRVAQFTESASELDSRLSHKEYYAEKIEGLKPESRRLREILAVRCLIKGMMGEEQRIVYDENGKPSLDCTPVKEISISHTDGYVAAIIGDRPVGIDIERIGKKVKKVTSRFMQESESELVKTVIGPESPENLLLHLIWSAKEAAFKVLGQEYLDLQNLTRVENFDFGKKTMIMNVEGREMPLTINFDYTENYVICYLILD